MPASGSLCALLAVHFACHAFSLQQRSGRPLPLRVRNLQLGRRKGDMDEIKALAADLGWLSRYPHKPKTLLYLAVFEYACAGAIEASDARAIYSAFADRALANSGTDAVQVSKLRTM